MPRTRRTRSGWTGRGASAKLERGLARSVVPLAAAAAVLASGGCSHALFKRGVQRSQFQTYDSVRNRHAPDYYEDEFGRQRINLRGRLLTRE